MKVFSFRATIAVTAGTVGAAIAIRAMHDYWRYTALARVHHASQEDVVFFVGMLAWSFGGAAIGGAIAGLLDHCNGLRRGIYVSLGVLAAFGIGALMSTRTVGHVSTIRFWLSDLDRPWYRDQMLWSVLGVLVGGPTGSIAAAGLARRAVGRKTRRNTESL